MATCNKCKRQCLGDCNDSPRCYNCGRTGHLARDCQNCRNCGKPSHLIKDCLNYYNCRKLGHFPQDCPEHEGSNLKQGNARVYGLTQGEVEASTSQVLVGQISIAHTSAYTLIDSGVLHSFVSTIFVKKLDMEPVLLDEVCVVSLSSGEYLTLRFSFKDVPIKVTGRELPVDLISFSDGIL